MEQASKTLRFTLWLRSNGNCECRGGNCDHHEKDDRCDRPLREATRYELANWDAYRIDPTKGYCLSNCIALCNECIQNNMLSNKQSH